jgi:class 3 adenylate cyclase
MRQITRRSGGSGSIAEPRSYTPHHLAEKILTTRSALEGERKQVTVLFADVQGSMALAEQVDPEEWHRIMDRFFQILSDGVHRFEGTINQYTGDGIMALSVRRSPTSSSPEVRHLSVRALVVAIHTGSLAHAGGARVGGAIYPSALDCGQPAHRALRTLASNQWRPHCVFRLLAAARCLRRVRRCVYGGAQ